MSSKMNKAAYQQLIAEDLAWLGKQPRTLEREHIKLIIQRSVMHEYETANEHAIREAKEVEERARNHD